MQFTWCQAIALYQHLTGLGFQWWHDDRSGVPTAVSLWNPFGVVAVPIILPCAMLHGVRAVVAGGIGVGGVMHGDTADDILPLLGQGAATIAEKWKSQQAMTDLTPLEGSASSVRAKHSLQSSARERLLKPNPRLQNSLVTIPGKPSWRSRSE